MKAAGIGASARRVPGLACALALALLVAAAARADLVTMQVSYSGGSASARLHVSLGTESVFLSGPTAEGSEVVELHADEPMLVQVAGEGVGEYRIAFSPPPQFGTLIGGSRQAAYVSAASSPRDVNHLLSVALIRREALAPHAIPLGQAASIAWHPPKILGAKGPYVDFNVGHAENGEALPPLRIPLLPRGITDEPLPIDLPDSAYTPAGGGFLLVTPQVVVRLSLDTQSNGNFWLTFHPSAEGSAFARYHFQFPVWPAHWSQPRRAVVLNDGTAMTSGRNYETSLSGFFHWSGMVQTAPTNTWTLDDWHVVGQSSLRTVLGRRDAASGGSGPFGQWFNSGSVTDTFEVRLDPQAPGLAERQTRSFHVFDRWLTEDPLDGIQTVIAPHEVITGTGSENGVTRHFQDPRAQTVKGSENSLRQAVLIESLSTGRREYESWLSSSPEFRPDNGWGFQILPNDSARTTIAYEMSSDLAGLQLPVSVVRQVRDTVFARAEIAYTTGAEIITAERRDHASAAPNDFITTRVRRYRPDATVAALRHRLYSIEHASGAQQSVAYRVDGAELRVATLAGATSGGVVVSGLPDFGPVAPLHLVPYRSTKTVEIFRRGLLVRRETWVYLGGSGPAPLFNSGPPVSWEDFEYTIDGRLRKRTASDNTSYTATWSGTRKVEEEDETGLKTTFLYDAMDRVIARVREAVGNLPAQAASFDYDSAHRIRYHRVGPVDSGGQPIGEQLVTELRYDLGGRITHHITPGGAADGSTPSAGIATTYAYGNGGRDVFASLPQGSRNVIRHPDGRLQAISGTAVLPATTYSYALDDNGRLSTTIRFASQRPRTLVSDWLGRTVEERRDGPVQDGGVVRPIITTHSYDPRGLLTTTRVAEQNGATLLSLAADRVFTYDAFGELNASGVDLDGTPGLQESSSDRLVTTESKFYLDANHAWWLHDSARLFHTLGSAAHHTSQRFVRLTGFSAGQTAQVDRLDYHNNRTSETRSVSPALKARLHTVQGADATRRISTVIGGQVVSEQMFSDSGLPVAPAIHLYDAQGRLRQSTSPRGIVTRHDYHAGTLQLWRSFEGRNEQGQEILNATFAYDASGRVIAITDAAGRTATTSYYPNGLIRDRGGDATRPLHYEYDAIGQLRELWTYRNGPGGAADRTIWDYDPGTGWPTGRTDAAGRRTSYHHAFSGSHRIVTRTSPRGGLTTTYRYRLDTGELATVDYSDATPDLAYTYTRTGRVDTVSDATGIRDLLYDREQLSAEHLGAWYGGLVLTTLPDDTTTQNPGANRVPGRYAGLALGYVPILNGAPQTQDMAREMRVSLGYDDLGRPNAVSVSHGGQLSASFTYDYVPNSSFWRSRSSGSFRHERTPAAGRDALKSVSTSWGTSVLAEHVHAIRDTGELTSIVQRGALFRDYGDELGTTSFVYDYNGYGELTTASGHLGAAGASPLPGRNFSYDYDTAGNRRSVGVGSNQAVYHGAPGVPGADPLNRIWERATLPGRITGTAHPEASMHVGGSAVTRQQGSRYWDAVIAGWGRFTELNLSATRNGQSQSGSVWRLIRPEREALEYDEAGNLAADSLWRYHYDAENRLIRMTTRTVAELPGLGWQASPPARELRFTYDHLGRRVEKVALKDNVVTFSRRFVYAGWNLLAEFEWVNGVPNVRRSYAWGLDASGSLDAMGGIGALVLETIHQGSGRTHYHVATDGLGNVIALLDQNGAAAAVYEYDPFGQPLRAEGTTTNENLVGVDQPGDNPLRYATKYWDRETGLYDYGRRFYDPGLGRFLNRDPLGEAGGSNLYAFAGNSPVNRWEYLGLNDREREFRPEFNPFDHSIRSDDLTEVVRSREGVNITENSGYNPHWGTDTPTSTDPLIGFVVTRGLPAAVAEGTAARGSVSIFARANPLLFFAGLLTPTTAHAPGINDFPRVTIREGYVIPENADPDRVAEFFRTRETDPERARQILRDIWNGADIRRALPTAILFPRGFKNQAQFDQAMKELSVALLKSGITDGIVGVRGSSVTGISSNPNSPSYGQPFGPGSDIDVFVQSLQLTGQYKGNPAFVHPAQLLRDNPTLRAWSEKWKKELGRDITPAAWKPGSLPSTPAIVSPKYP